MAEKMTQYLGTGRRKTSVARVRLIPGGQGVEINGKAMEEYFGGRAILSKIVEQPLALTETLNKFAVKVNVVGGGNSGQAGAIRHGVARALLLADGTLTGITLTQKAFEAALGYSGTIFIAIALFFFAFSTIIGWYFFGEANIKYLFGKKAINIYRILVMVAIFIGSTQKIPTNNC